MSNEKLNNQEYPAVNREYKDRLFRFVFQRREDLLSLYNAVNGTDYRDPEALEINTRDNAVKKEPCLECITTMLNINYGHNQELMEKCRRLKEYAIFVETVRRNLTLEIPFRAATMQAVDECIEEGVLADILVSQKAEVVQMILETFDQEKHDEAMKKEGYEAGRADGQREGRREGKKEGKKEGQKLERENGIRRLILSLMEAGVPEENISLSLQKQYELSPEEAERYLGDYQE